MTQLAVIIPYYQKTSGILQRALRSVLAQVLPPDISVQIIVVDDGSPAPAEQDIRGLDMTTPFSLTLVRQPNGGVAAARDLGLRSVNDATDYIAFLDSDDMWKPDHIAKAVVALDRGYDFYFTDHDRVSHHASHFSVIHFPPADAPSQAVRNIGGTVWEIDRDFYFGFSLRTFTAQISTVVYRRAVHPQARFELSLRASGEDRLFMLQVVDRSQKICFCTGIGATCGEGVNIYYSTFGWEDEGHIKRCMNDILAAYALKSAFQLSTTNIRHVDELISNNRKSFAYFTLRWFLKRRGGWSQELKNLTKRDPNFWYWYPLALISLAIFVPLKLFRPS